MWDWNTLAIHASSSLYDHVRGHGLVYCELEKRELIGSLPTEVWHLIVSIHGSLIVPVQDSLASIYRARNEIINVFLLAICC